MPIKLTLKRLDKAFDTNGKDELPDGRCYYHFYQRTIKPCSLDKNLYYVQYAGKRWLRWICKKHLDHYDVEHSEYLILKLSTQDFFYVQIKC